MSPVPTVGKISFTKFTSPEAMVQKLAVIEPGVTTAADVEQSFISSDVIEGSTPAPLWNDLIDYSPAVEGRTAAGSQVVIDNELLRAARSDAPYRFVLFWAALNLADKRLDEITRLFLTDSEDRFDPDIIDRNSLGESLSRYAVDDPDFPRDGKAVSNILSLLERCQLIEPRKYGGSIVGAERLLPTRSAVAPLVLLVSERLNHQGVIAHAGRGADLAVAIGANAWLGLTRDEFLNALSSKSTESQPPTVREKLPDDLHEIATQLRRKRQVVLQGPPGAGKTYVARRYVEWATAGRVEESRFQSIIDELPVNERTIDGIAAAIVRRGVCAVWDIVQFHPGYDYTDFVRALVAEPHANGVTFSPRHKLLSLIAGVGEVLQRQGHNVELVLLLDEINRGNIANIFGELLYALEYRGEAVSTPYTVDGDSSITIPANLFLIGTMNTADRSIAVIDYALRRRFVFLNVAATDAPIRSFNFDSEVTRSAALHLSVLTAHALVSAPDGLRVGPSYFLARPDETATSLEVLAARYIYEVLPLLAEYEMEGEIDATAVVELCSALGINCDLPQRERAAELAAHLVSLNPVDGTLPTEDSPLVAPEAAVGESPRSAQ